MKLREWRRTNGLTGDQAAKQVGVAQSTWSQYENGTRRPSPEIAARIEALSDGQVKAADLLGLPLSGTGVAESAAEFAADTPSPSKSMAETREHRMAPQPVTVGVPRELLERSREYGLDVEALIAEGGLPALRAAFQKAFFETHREAIEWTRNYVDTHGTPSEQLGMI